MFRGRERGREGERQREVSNEICDVDIRFPSFEDS